MKWHPKPGLNCIIGSGDSGKSTIIDPIGMCLGARHIFQFTDADFHGLAIAETISITVSWGNRTPELKSIDGHGLYLTGFNVNTLELEDEPGVSLETVLSVNIRVKSDLEAVWSVLSNHNLSWRRCSILNRSLTSPSTRVAITRG